MTLPQRSAALIAMGGLFLLAGIVVSERGLGPRSAAVSGTDAATCASCTARHQRLLQGDQP